MAIPHPKCSRTGRRLTAEVVNVEGAARCPCCDGEIHALVFPALFRADDVSSSGEAITQEMESSCFYHATKKAVRVCDACGVFLCALCDVKLGERHLCPGCIEKGRVKGRMKELESHRTRYDDIAVSVAVGSLFFFCLAILIAPVAIYLAVRHWNTPCSVVPRSRVRHVVAITIASLALAGWIGWVVYLIRNGNF